MKENMHQKERCLAVELHTKFYLKFYFGDGEKLMILAKKSQIMALSTWNSV